MSPNCSSNIKITIERIIKSHPDLLALANKLIHDNVFTDMKDLVNDTHESLIREIEFGKSIHEEWIKLPNIEDYL